MNSKHLGIYLENINESLQQIKESRSLARSISRSVWERSPIELKLDDITSKSEKIATYLSEAKGRLQWLIDEIQKPPQE